MKCPNCGAQLPADAKFCGSCGCKVEGSPKTVAVRKPTTPVAQPEQMPTAVEPDHGAAASNKKRLPILIIGVVVLLIIAAVVVRGLLGGSSGKSAYVMLQDGRYELLKDLDKGDLIDIAATKSDDDAQGMARFSQDGKYFYFFTKYDYNSDTGTLCRAEYAKLKENSSKNDQYITTIASNVSIYFVQMKGDALLYQNDNDTLYYFDGKESTQIAKDVDGIYPLGEDNYTEILYTRQKDDYSEDLYYLSTDKLSDPVKIDGSIDNLILYTDVNNLAYTKADDDGEEVLYTAGLNKDPEKIASKVYSVYTDTVNNRYFYRVADGETVSAYDFVNDPYQVTEEPSWTDFYNNGSYDDDAYSKAWQRYYARQTLMSSDYDLEYSTIYCLENGTVSTVVENVLSTNTARNGFVYWGADAFAEGFDVDDIEYGSDVSSALEYLSGNATDVVDSTKIMVYNGLTNKTSPLASSQDEEVVDALCNGYLYLTSNGAVISNWNDGSLQKASIDNGTIGKFSLLADSGSIQRVSDDVIYYTADSYDRDNKTYVDLYSFSKGESTRIAQDILASTAKLYEDGSLYVYTDSNDRGGELTCIDKNGTKNVIADEVTQYFRADKSTIMYIADHDLYSYDGKEKTRVATDVDRVWAASELKPELTFGLYY